MRRLFSFGVKSFCGSLSVILIQIYDLFFYNIIPFSVQRQFQSDSYLNCNVPLSECFHLFLKRVLVSDLPGFLQINKQTLIYIDVCGKSSLLNR